MADWLREWLVFLSAQKEGLGVIATFLGIIGGTVGLCLLFWRTRATAQQARAALKTAEVALNRHISQTEADRDRRITDAFAKATEQLENEKLSARLGAIYTLGRIADESIKDYWPTMETLNAFITERRPPPTEEQILRDEEPVPLKADISAALHVIGRRNKTSIATHEHTDQRINLSYLDLCLATLRNCNLSYVNFTHTNFYKAKFFDCVFFDTLFFSAFLNDTRITEGTVFRFCHFSDAKLRDADLSGVVFDETDLSGASLENALIIRADFRTARALTQEQLNAACGDHSTLLPPDLQVPNSWLTSTTTAMKAHFKGKRSGSAPRG